MDELVSVIVPVYNNETTVRQTIESVLTQEHREIELIVVNDGSTDGSLGIVEGLADDRTTVITIANSGTSGARNAGFRHASGRLVAFLDADDYWFPGKLVRQLEVLASEPDIGVIGHLMRYENLAGRVLGVTGEIIDDEAADRIRLGRFVPFQISSALFRTEDVRAMGAFDIELAQSEDMDLYTRLAQAGARFHTVDEVLGTYRIHGTSISASQFAVQRRMVRYNAARAEARIRGGDLSLDEFSATYRPTLNDRRTDLGREFYRATGLAVAEGRWWRAIRYGAGAMGLVPIYSLRRIRRQRRSVPGL